MRHRIFIANGGFELACVTHLFCTAVSRVCQWLLNNDPPTGWREDGKIVWNKLPQFRVLRVSWHERHILSGTDPFFYIGQGGGNCAK